MSLSDTKFPAITALTLQIMVLASVPLIYFRFPVIYARFTAEDNWGEFATFVAFAFAAVVFLVLFLKRRRNGWWLALAFACGFVALEEISWGQRLVVCPLPICLGAITFKES